MIDKLIDKIVEMENPVCVGLENGSILDVSERKGRGARLPTRRAIYTAIIAR